MKLRESSTNLLVASMTGAMERYEQVMPPGQMQDINYLGIYLGGWRNGRVVVKESPGEIKRDRGVLSAQVIYTIEGEEEDFPKLVFRARSQEIPEEVLARNGGPGILRELEATGPQYKRGTHTHSPFVSVSFARHYDRPPGGLGDTSHFLRDDARIRVELQRDTNEELITVTRGHVGTDNSILSKNRFAVAEAATPKEFATMFGLVFKATGQI